VMALLGDDEMAVWFRQTREADPSARLYVNDYNITENGGFDLARQDALFGVVKRLVEAGAPVDGVGLQSHFGVNLTAPERVYEIFDKFARLGQDLLITEFDVSVADEQLQADYLRDYLTFSFSHKAVKGFYIWGFWEGRHWRPQAAMLRRDFSPKPSHDAWRRLVFGEWWTEVEGKTDAEGVFRARGFLGDYEAEAAVGGETLVRQFRVARGEENRLVIGR